MDRTIANSPLQRLWIVVLLLGLTLSAAPAIARHYPIETYRSDNGLPQAQVISICQDRQGAIWFGTFSGLCYFDGVAFHTFTWPDGPRGREINNIIESTDGTLWVGTSIGVSRYRDGLWRDYSAEDGMPDRWINDLLDDGDGGVWVAHYNGLTHLHSDGTVEQGKTVDEQLGQTVFCLDPRRVTARCGAARPRASSPSVTESAAGSPPMMACSANSSTTSGHSCSGTIIAGGPDGASFTNGSGRWAPSVWARWS